MHMEPACVTSSEVTPFAHTRKGLVKMD